MKRKIIDAHMHIGHFGEWTIKRREVKIFPNREIDGAQKQRLFMQQCGITKAVIVPHYVPDLRQPFEIYNPVVLDAVKKLDNIKGGLWVTPLAEAQDLLDEVLAKKPVENIKALKMSANAWPGKKNMSPKSWPDEMRVNMERIMEYAKKNDLTIHMHTGSGNSAIKYFEPFIDKYGDHCRMQMVHMGNTGGGVMAFVPRFIEWLQKGYDLYCDTSECWGYGPNWLIHELLKHHPEGINRMLFASDNPWGVFDAEVQKIKSLDVDEEIKQKIFYDNAEELYWK